MTEQGGIEKLNAEAGKAEADARKAEADAEAKKAEPRKAEAICSMMRS